MNNSAASARDRWRIHCHSAPSHTRLELTILSRRWPKKSSFFSFSTRRFYRSWTLRTAPRTARPAQPVPPRSHGWLPQSTSLRKSPINRAPFTRKPDNSACTVCVCHLLFLNTIVYYLTSLSPGDGGGPPFHERKEKAFPDHCVVMSQETVSAAHCVTSSNPTKFHFSSLEKLLWPVSRQLGNWHCAGDRRVRLSGPQGALPGRETSPSPQRGLCFYIFSSFTCVKPRGAGSGVNGPRADARMSGRGSRSPIPTDGAFNFTRPKTSASVTGARRCS